MNPTALTKLRVFAPQLVAFAGCDGFALLAAWAYHVHPVIHAQSACAAVFLGCCALVTTLNKAIEIGGAMSNGWGQYIPDKPRPCRNCASMAAEHAKLLADRDELREALVTLEIK